MSATTLVAQIKAGSPEAQATASSLGQDALPAVTPLVDDADPEVRILALACLNIIGGPMVPTIALRKVGDEDDQVVGEALQVLQGHPPAGHAADLLTLYREAGDGFVRERLALIAGRLAPQIDVIPWRKLWREAPAGSELERNLLAAVARMGDADARRAFADRLHASRGSESAEWLDLALYLDNGWVVPELVALLDRTETAVELAPDRNDTLPLRVCDLAADTILNLTGASVSFDTGRTTPYTPEELRQVRAVAAQGGSSGR